MSGLLIDYNFQQHVASDVGIDDKYLPPTSYGMQDTLNQLSSWTSDNLIKINASKCNYMVFSRSKEQFSTRLTIDNAVLERKQSIKILGVWLSDDLSWSRNCKEICIKAYSRMSMLTKLKYVGVKLEDLIDIYVLYIRSITEYCSVAFYSNLTVEESNNLKEFKRHA